MIIDPFRLYRRHQRLMRDAEEEVQYLRRRYGDGGALDAAHERLAGKALTRWGRRVLEQTIKLLERGA